LAEHRVRELLCPQRPCEKKALYQIKAHFADRLKVGAGLDALGAR
jgi:hypothetical protein